MTDQPPADRLAMQLNINAQIINGPDGKPLRIALQLAMGTTGYQIQMDVEQALGLGKVIERALAEAYDQAKRAQLGLVIPGVGDVRRINGEVYPTNPT